MNKEEARLLLAARRPSGADDHAPEMAEALATAAAEPELAEWLAGESAFDAAVALGLSKIAPPADLKATLLATAPPPARGGGFTRRSWLWATAGAAAAFAVSAVVYRRTRTPLPQLAEFRTDVIDFFDNHFGDKFDLKEERPERIMQWLASQPKPVTFEAPGDLPAGGTIGCRFIEWRGNTATLVCFRPPGSPKPIHVFMIPATAIAGASPVLAPVEQVGNWNSTTWTRNDRAYVAISKLPPEEITRHLTA